MIKIGFFVLLSLSVFACSTSREVVSTTDKPIDITQYYCSTKNGPYIGSNLNSALLYSEMRACLIKHNYASAAFLFSLSGTLSWYETTNNENIESRNQHITRLKNNLVGIPADSLSRFWSQVHEILGTPARLAETCNKLSTLSMDIDRQFSSNRNVSWQKALENYLHCPS